MPSDGKRVTYRVEIVRSAAAEIRAIGRKAERRRFVERIVLLGSDPRPTGCRKLGGRNGYRIRQGDYRVIYTIDDVVRIVAVVRVAHRREAYR